METPLSFSIDPRKGIVNVHYRKDPSVTEWGGMMQAILTHPSYRRGFAVLLDRREISNAPTTDYIKRCLRFVRDHQETMGATRWAVVASDLATYGMGRMASQILECDACLRAFLEMDEAVAWLEEKTAT